MINAIIDTKRKSRMSIFVKFLLVSIVSTIIPIIITGILIVLSYQEVIGQILIEQKTELIEESEQGLFLTLSNIRIQIGLILFIVIILTLFSNILMARNLLTQPLKKLAKGTKEVAKGNLDYSIKIETKDELGELAESFNAMIEQLKKEKTISEKARVNLEKNRKELQERVTELERFYQLTVGRELKLLELKKRVKKLEEKLGEEEA